MFHCLICNQAFEFQRTADVDFLWTDDLYHGRPVCKGCTEGLKGHPHFNYEIPKKTRKKTGLEKWL